MTHVLGAVPVTPVRAHAHDTSPVVTELLLGEGAAVREEVGDFFALRTTLDGVVGYARREELCRVDAHYHDNWLLNAAWCGGGSLLVRNQTLVVPLRARLLLDGAERVRLPGGASAHLVAGQVASLGLTFATARRMSPAAWAWQHFGGAKVTVGGITPFGTDAGGMIQTTFLARGTRLPRDVVSQSREGIAIGLTEIAAGDVLYRGVNATDAAMEAALIDSPERLIRASDTRGVVVREEWDGHRMTPADGWPWSTIRRFL